MGKTTTDLKNRMKVVRANRTRFSEEELDTKAKIAEYISKIRQIETDMERFGENQMMRAKIRMYNEQLTKLGHIPKNG